jgi:hypothetical protein
MNAPSERSVREPPAGASVGGPKDAFDLGAKPTQPSEHAGEAVQQDEHLVRLGLGDKPDGLRTLDGRSRFVAFRASDPAPLLAVGTLA